MLKKHIALAAGVSLGLLALVIHSGCSVDSADNVIRSVSINVGGVYRYDDGSCGGQGKFVSVNSGRPVSSLNLRQAGDALEAIDNNGIIFRGTIGRVVENNASFNMEGATTAGNGVTISGNIAVNGNAGVMQATWIEESFFATLCGSSTGQSVITNNPPVTNTNGNVSIGFDLKSQEKLAAYAKLVWWTAGS